MALRETEQTLNEFRNPVAVVVFGEENSKVLLVKHEAARKNGTYGVPGGRPKASETPEETALRELEEETGLEVSYENLVKIPGVYKGVLKRGNGNRYYSLDVFVAKSFSGDIRKSGETTPVWAKVETLGRRRSKLMPSVEQMVFDGLQLISND